MSACCLSFAFVIATTFAGLYWGLVSHASDFDAVLAEASTKPITSYDWCGSTEAHNTNWSSIYLFNAILYTTVSAFLIISFIGIIKVQLLKASLCCVNTASFAILICIVFTGISRFNIAGTNCAESKVDDLFAEDGATLKNLFIAQCILLVPFNCLVSCTMFTAGAAAVMKQSRDDDFWKENEEDMAPGSMNLQ